MGTYSTVTSIYPLLVGTKEDTATSALISSMIDKSEAEVNKWLSKRYDIAAFQTAVPPLVTQLTNTLTEGYFRKRNGRGSKDALAFGNDLVKEAMDNLQALACGEANLLDTAGSQIPVGDDSYYAVLCNTSDFSPTFNEDKETRWKVDPDKLDEIAGERD